MIGALAGIGEGRALANRPRRAIDAVGVHADAAKVAAKTAAVAAVVTPA